MGPHAVGPHIGQTVNILSWFWGIYIVNYFMKVALWETYKNDGLNRHFEWNSSLYISIALFNGYVGHYQRVPYLDHPICDGFLASLQFYFPVHQIALHVFFNICSQVELALL